MKNVYFVVFLLLFTSISFADTLDDELLTIQDEWAQIHYKYPQNEKRDAFARLLKQATALAVKYPGRAEPIIIQATLVLSRASTEKTFSALKSVREGRKLLNKAIVLNPAARHGSALVTLGTLYYRVPGWPIAFGNDKKAEKLLLSALEINPHGIDTNYYYGHFLLSQDKPVAAVHYLQKAINANPPIEESFATAKLQEQAQKALETTQLRNISDAKSAINSLK